MLECRNGHYYTGYTNDLKKRLAAHRGGASGAKYTRANPPVGVARCWLIDGGRGSAMRVEAFIKGLTRAEKVMLIKRPGLLKVMLKVRKGEETARLVLNTARKRAELK